LRSGIAGTALALLLALGTAQPASAQSVQGAVRQASNAPAAYAIVTFNQNGQEKARAITDADGNYYVRKLTAGRYDVRILSKSSVDSQSATVAATGGTFNFRMK
jgi:hypothetical protein